MKPQVTIVVASLYEDDKLNKTIKSCLEQLNTYLELIVCIKSPVLTAIITTENVNSHIFKKVYRDDTGISDSWNFAISISESDYALFLGGGDSLFSSYSIYKLLRVRYSYPENIFLVLYGNQYIHRNGMPARPFSKRVAGRENFLMTKYMSIPHGSSLWSTNLLKLSAFSLKYSISIDYEFALRWNNFIEYRYADVDVAFFEFGGLSNSPNTSLSVILQDCRIKASFFYSPFSGWRVNIKRFVRWVTKL